MSPQESDIAKRIGILMKTARKQKGLIQAQVAKRLGVSQSALSKMESGILVPSAPQWFDFCSLTGILPDSLTAGEILLPKPPALKMEFKSELPRFHS